MKKGTFFFVMLIALLGTSLAVSQTGLGRIGGFIYDEDGKAVIGATVRVSSDALMGERVVVSGDKNGYYRIIKLPPGKYTLHISKEKYEAQEITGVSVRAGKTSSLNINLKVGEFEQVMTIKMETPLIDVSSPQRQINIDGDFIERLPLSFDRDWNAVWALSPGTINEGEYGPYKNRVAVHGADIFQNVWNLDGMNIGSTYTNSNQVYFSPDIIEDVELVTTGFDASIASGQGGYVNVVTKSGGNDFHGTVSYTYQPEAWNWSNVDDGEAAKQSLYMPEFTLGGPIAKDETWFFMNYRYTLRNEAYAREADQLAVFDQLEVPRPTQSRRTTGHHIFGKITHTLTDDIKLIGTYNYDEGAEKNADMGWNYADNSGVDIENGGQYFNGTVEGVLGKNFDYSLRMSYYKSNNLIFGTGGLDQPSMVRYADSMLTNGRISGAGSFIYTNNRRGSAWGSDSSNNRLEMRGDARYYLEDYYGNHSLSFGFSAVPKQEAINDSVYAPTTSIYETRDASGNWVPFYQQTYNPTRTQGSSFGIKNYSGYMQDTWVVYDRLTINAGVRMETQKDDVVIDITEFSPNLGFNYAITSDLENTFRGSWGIRHTMLAGRDGVSSTQGDSPTRTRYYDNDLDGVWDEVIEYPGAKGGKTDGSNLTDWYGSPITYADDIGMPYAIELQLGYTRILPLNLKFDAAWIYKINKNQMYQYDNNVIYQNGNFMGLNDENYNSVWEYINNDKQSNHFNSYELTLTKEFSDNWQLMASYTYQQSTLKGEWLRDDPRRYMHPSSWFESKNNDVRPHVFRVAANIVFPYEINVNLNVLYQSGPTEGAKFMPKGTGLDVASGFELANGKVIDHPFWTVNPYYQARNLDRDVNLDSKFVLNLGLGKDFDVYDYRLQAQVQIFNLLNDDSWAGSYYGNYVDATGTPLYPEPFNYWKQPPRAAQMLLKFIF